MARRTSLSESTNAVFCCRKNRYTVFPSVENLAKRKNLVEIFNGFLAWIVRFDDGMVTDSRTALPVYEVSSNGCVSLVHREFQEGSNAALIRM